MIYSSLLYHLFYGNVWKEILLLVYIMIIRKFRKHLRKHLAEKQVKCVKEHSCPFCNTKLVVNYRTFLKHERLCEVQHAVGEDFMCSVCGQSFPTHHLMYKHHYRCSGKGSGKPRLRKPCLYEGCDYSSSLASSSRSIGFSEIASKLAPLAKSKRSAKQRKKDRKEAAESERQLAKARAAQKAPTNAALRFGQLFELTTPMLVMPFGVFQAQGRIMKSTKAWRDEALAAGSLVEHEEGSGKIVIFISHTWWDRSFRDATNDPNNPYDKGAPDLQRDYPDVQREGKYNRQTRTHEMVTYQRPKNLKWRIICAGVQRLLEQEGLKEEEVSLWVDWQSIYQDDEVEKLKGVVSLIRYATLCQYMLVPTEEPELARHVSLGRRIVRQDISLEDIPGYGSRDWWWATAKPPHPSSPLACTHIAPVLIPARRLARPRSRIEYFVFSLLAEMQEHEVQLYAIKRDGALNRYPEVQVNGEEDMPSGGALSNPNDKALVKDLEDKMIEAYGTALVEVKCKAAGGEMVDLSNKMLRPQHVGALFAAVERYRVAELDLTNNQLGAEGGALVAAALKTNTTLTELGCAQLGRPSNQGR